MKRSFLALVAVAVVLTGCTTTGSNSGPASVVDTASGASHAPVTLNVWSFYSGREFQEYSVVLNEFMAKYPWITIQHTPAKQPKDIVAAINSGTKFDVAISAGPDNVAKYCATGAFQDLAPYIKAQNMDLPSIIPPQALRYTSYNGVQCTLPVLSDAYGMYYNNDMFAQAGIKSPPKTFSELTQDAKKLTVFNPDGSIKVAGFVPLGSFYENPNLFLGNFSGGKWYDANGKSAFASRSLVGQPAHLAAEVHHRRLRTRRLPAPAAVHRPDLRHQRHDRILPTSGVRNREARDGVRRRVADRLHRKRQVHRELQHGALPGRGRYRQHVRTWTDRRRHDRHPEDRRAPLGGMAPHELPGHRYQG